MNHTQYTLIKIPLRELIRNDFDLQLTEAEEINREYLVAQGDSLLFDQIERLRGFRSERIREVILVTARKNPNQETALRTVLRQGFTYNGVHFSRFGKSASQGKDGITAFVCDSIFDELYRITQMDIPVDHCVIAKYEAQRCLAFSACSLIHDYMPNIVIIGEYEKTLPGQLIKYVTEREKELFDEETGKTVVYQAREVQEGLADIRLSPFDGCGCHEREFMEQVSAQLGLDYNAIGVQVRMPFMKGYSVYVPFRDILKEWGVETITDVYGRAHPVDTIDCIWNISMFKGHKLFRSAYGDRAWDEYRSTVEKYRYKLGISKYSHHIRNLSKYTRMNFQYLQCLDLWNPKYIRRYEERDFKYDILDERNDGKIVGIAKYTTALLEKILKGDRFYTYKFMGITDTLDYEPESRYLEAALIHDGMLKDPAVKQFIYRKLKKMIDEAKVGKIYCSGFYHTGVGDMIGYLQYAAGMEPVGCLGERELYSANFECGDILSFRSPLVDPSEVNRIRIVRNDLIRKWFGHFKDQDVVMFNLHDISAPQQGGADFDGDIFFLCDDPVIVASKIEKPVILDIEDKQTAQSRAYTAENLVEYEVMTRDNRIGEITNVATSIENRYTTDENLKKIHSDYCSLLRIFQGKEIDFLKTGFRWHMNRGLQKHLKQLPYFLLYNYPQKRALYEKLQEKNKGLSEGEERMKLNAYHSPSPMNELCDYICAWEKKRILWDRCVDDLAETRPLILNSGLDLTDRAVLRVCRNYINDYAAAIKLHFSQNSGAASHSGTGQRKFSFELIVNDFKRRLRETLKMDEVLIANYVIAASYRSLSVSKAFAWSAYGDYIIANLKQNAGSRPQAAIREVPAGTEGAYEYLGKYFVFEGDDSDLPV